MRWFYVVGPLTSTSNPRVKSSVTDVADHPAAFNAFQTVQIADIHIGRWEA